MPEDKSEVEQPAWAISWGEREDGSVVYEDTSGDRFVALAVTRGELRLLESALQGLPMSDGTVELLQRLAQLHADLDE